MFRLLALTAAVGLSVLFFLCVVTPFVVVAQPGGEDEGSDFSLPLLALAADGPMERKHEKKGGFGENPFFTTLLLSSAFTNKERRFRFDDDFSLSYPQADAWGNIDPEEEIAFERKRMKKKELFKEEEFEREREEEKKRLIALLFFLNQRNRKHEKGRGKGEEQENILPLILLLSSFNRRERKFEFEDESRPFNKHHKRESWSPSYSPYMPSSYPTSYPSSSYSSYTPSYSSSYPSYPSYSSSYEPNYKKSSSYSSSYEPNYKKSSSYSSSYPTSTYPTKKEDPYSSYDYSQVWKSY